MVFFEADVLLRGRYLKDFPLRLSGFAPKDRAALLELLVKRADLMPATSRKGLYERPVPGLVAPGSAGNTLPLGGLWQVLTQRSQAALSTAHDLAASQGTPVAPEHLALGLLNDATSPAARLVVQSGVSIVGAQAALAERIGKMQLASGLGMDPRLRRVLHDARREAEQDRRRFIGPEHLLIAVVQEPRSAAAEVFRTAGFDVDTARLYAELASSGGSYAVETLTGA